MPGSPLLFKTLVVGILLLGSMALLTNIIPSGRHTLRSRKISSSFRSPLAVVAAVLGQDEAGDSPIARSVESSKGEEKIRKTEEEWKEQLSEEQYQVTRCSATERAFTGKYWSHHEAGTYTCVGCGQSLFSSDSKFDSGTGWPSYYQPVSKEAVGEIKDISYGMVRTEIICSRCEAHLGHVFPDGPRPTGLRYCINSASLDFVTRDTGDKDTGDRETSDKDIGDRESGNNTTGDLDQVSSASP